MALIELAGDDRTKAKEELRAALRHGHESARVLAEKLGIRD
jgi:hypothetical protein